jgi:hypothetical protein
MTSVLKLYRIMGKEDKVDYARLLAMEISSSLAKIYRTMRRNVPLPVQSVSSKDILIKDASPGATKAWEFMLNPRDSVAKGDVGKIVVVSRGLGDETVRKQRALLIAAEFYVYHAFANHPDPAYFRSIRCQNQYWDIAKKLFGIKNSHDVRDRAVRYVIEEIKEHRIAHFRGHGWHTSIAKLDKHYPEIASLLGSSERTFNEIFRKQRSTFTHDMLVQEDDLVRKEIEDISHIESSLRELEKRSHTKGMYSLVKLHLANLKTFREILEGIRKGMDSWILVDKEEHRLLKRKAGLTAKDIQRMLQAEAEAEQIDINRVHVLFWHFKKEKINILRDIELIGSNSSHGKAAR